MNACVDMTQKQSFKSFITLIISRQIFLQFIRPAKDLAPTSIVLKDHESEHISLILWWGSSYERVGKG